LTRVRISVVIPCYNAAPYIGRALASVAAQEFPAHEIVVVNDASTDDSVEVIERSGVPVRLIHTQCRSATGARGAGIRAATGEWLAFLDADDFFYPTHLARARAALDGRDDVAYMAHLDCMYHETGEIFAPSTGPLLLDLEQGIAAERFMELFAQRWYFSPSGVLARREVVLAVGGPNPRLSAAGDVELFLRVIAGKTWTYQPQPGWCYRLGTPGNLSSRRMRCEAEMLETLLNNEAGYPGSTMAGAIRHCARRVMALAATDGAEDDVQQAWDTAWPRLPRLAQAYFLCWKVWPGFFRRIIQLKRRVQALR
jgi:glycosyltransferase involved in cell wall biosynthesis